MKSKKTCSERSFSDHNPISHVQIKKLWDPVEHPQSPFLSETWVALGVRIDPEADRKKRMEKLYSALQDSLPDSDARHGDWLACAKSWSELLALWLQGDSETVAGLSFDQWVILRKILIQNWTDLLLRENAVLAWAPSTTAISRQALFDCCD